MGVVRMMKDDSNSSGDGVARWDAVFIQSRRELLGILIIWLFFALWVVGGSALTGYRPIEGEIEMVMGIPSWVFWSVGVPWCGANVVIFWFCLRVMKDQSLETDGDDSNGEAQSEH